MKVVLELLLGPVDEPYRALEALLDSGLSLLAKHLEVHGALDIEVLLNAVQSQVATSPGTER
jgi:hypothetical protein